MTGFFVESARADTFTALGVTNITATQTFATADDTFADGWKWVFDVTVPDDQTLLKMKFADWTNGSNIIPAGDNIQIYSAQSTNAIDENHAIGITASNTWSGTIYIDPSTDLDVSQGGRQIQIVVEARIPVGSAGGSYSTNYGIDSTATSTVALGNLVQTYDSTQKSITVATDPAGLQTSVTYNGSTTPPIHVGTYFVAATVTDPNYTGSATDTLVINPAPVTVTADPETKVYDGATTTDPVLAYNVTPSLFDGDVFTGAIARDPGEDVGSYAISSGTLALDGDYEMTFVPSTFVITKAAATIDLGDLEQIYDKTGKSVSTTTIPSGLGVGVSYDGSPALPVDVGTYSVVATIIDPNYEGSTTGSLTIDPASISVTATTSTKVYEGGVSSNGIPTVTSGTLFGTDSATWTQTFDTKDGGTGKTLTATGTINDGNNGNNYDIKFIKDDTGVIDPATATISVVGQDKVYDGTTDASTTLTANGALPGDELTASGTAAFDTKDVGTGKTVTVTGIVISGPGVTSGDYIYDTTATTTANVTPAFLSITAKDESKTYGDDLTFNGTEFTASGLLGDDSISSVDFSSDGTASTSTVFDSPYPIVPSNAVGNGIGDYKIQYNNGSLTVNPEPITVAADFKTKAFGTTDPKLTYQVTSGSLVDGDPITGALIRTPGEDVGSYPIDQGTLATDGNYYLTFASSTLTIVPAVAVVSLNDLNQTYGSVAPVTASTTPSGLSVVITYNGSPTLPTNAGDYKVIATINDNSYVGSTTGDLVIAPLPLTVTAQPNTKVYDGTTDATATPVVTGDIVTGDTASFKEAYGDPTAGTGKTLIPSGSVNDNNGGNNYSVKFVNDTTGVITALPVTVSATGQDKVYDGTTDDNVDLYVSGAINGDALTATGTAAFADQNIGNDKPITVTGITIDGPHAADYTPNATAVTEASITPAPLTITFPAKNKVYDGTTDAITDIIGSLFTIHGAIPSDELSFHSLNNAYFLDPNVGVGKELDINNIQLSLGSSDQYLNGSDKGNYDFTDTASTTADITPAPLTAVITANDKTYDGTTDASTTCSLIGVINGDSVVCEVSNASFDDDSVGTGKTVTATGLSLSGASAGNYVLDNSVATTTANILPQ